MTSNQSITCSQIDTGAYYSVSACQIFPVPAENKLATLPSACWPLVVNGRSYVDGGYNVGDRIDVCVVRNVHTNQIDVATEIRPHGTWQVMDATSWD